MLSFTPSQKVARYQCLVCKEVVFNAGVIAHGHWLHITCPKCAKIRSPNDTCINCEHTSHRYYQAWFYYPVEGYANPLLVCFLFCSEICFRMASTDIASDRRFIPVCERCYEPTTTECGRCHIPRYCSKLCQTLEWPAHKAACFKMASGASSKTPSEGFREPGHCYYCDANVPKGKDFCEACRSRPEFQLCRNCGANKGDKAVALWLGAVAKVIYHYCSDKCVREHRKRLRTERWVGEICARGHTVEYCRACTRCEKSFYCSVECQKADWPQHRDRCIERKKDPCEILFTCFQAPGGGLETFKRMLSNSRKPGLTGQDYEDPPGQPEEAPDP